MKLLTSNTIRKELKYSLGQTIDDPNIPTDEKTNIILGTINDYLQDRTEDILSGIFISVDARKAFADKLFETLLDY